MARLIKECEWKRDVNGFAREKVVRHVELFDKPSHGSPDVLPQSKLFRIEIKVKMYDGHLHTLGIIQECQSARF
jgi:hypothetical protein